MATIPNYDEKLWHRLWSHIEPEPTSGCWIWVGCRGRGGYGLAALNGRSISAHRLAYGMLRGPIPTGLTLDHLCRVRACVNPAHLEPVSLRANILRGEGFAAQFARRTQCHRGHDLVAGSRNRRRFCLQCRRLLVAARQSAGLCRGCNNPAVPGRSRCAHHLTLERLYRRDR